LSAFSFVKTPCRVRFGRGFFGSALSGVHKKPRIADGDARLETRIRIRPEWMVG